MTAEQDPWRTADGVVFLRLRLTPRASRDEIGGREDTGEGPAIKARVRAVPEDGKANAALEALVAGWLGVPRSAVSLVAGPKSRVKTVAIRADVTSVLERLGAHSLAAP
ncbi:MAG: DUF167 domain-containing protein [Hyphomicrobiaceae bacterium]